MSFTSYAPWHARLTAAYSARERHYHNLQHLEECLGALEQVRGLAADENSIAAALWFHDAVYDARSATNEEDSAQLAVDCLGAASVAEATTERVRRLILATKTHDAEGDGDAALSIDIDLAILGQPAERYWEYEYAIRTEYAWVAEEVFAQKRAEILRRFLARPTIYRTEGMRRRLEPAARANLAAAISRLEAFSS